MEKGLLAPVLTVLVDKVTNVCRNGRSLCAGKRRGFPREVSDEQLVPAQKKVCIRQGGCGVLRRKDQSLVDSPAHECHTEKVEKGATINLL